MDERQLFVVEERDADNWSPLTGCVSDREKNADYDANELSESYRRNGGRALNRYRVTRYVPEDETPRLLADWQSQTGGSVKWVSSDDSILCVLKADTRRAPGASGPLDPFGAACAALANWAAKWGAR